MLKIHSGSHAHDDYFAYYAIQRDDSLQCDVPENLEVSKGYRLAASLKFEEDEPANNQTQLLLNDISQEINRNISAFRTIGSLVHSVAKMVLERFFKETESCLLLEDEIFELEDYSEVDPYLHNNDRCNLNKECLITRKFISDKRDLYACQEKIAATLVQIQSCSKSLLLWNNVKRQKFFTVVCKQHKSLDRLFYHHVPRPVLEISTLNDIMLRTIIFQMNVMLDEFMPARFDTICSNPSKSHFLSQISKALQNAGYATHKIFHACIKSGHFNESDYMKKSDHQENKIDLVTEQGQREDYSATWQYQCVELKEIHASILSKYKT